ncbi:hypothetical protein HPB52_021269 [Rhipicephalus sanguineus]|uniref:Uncharacterized protein n=1 Tax=Rhipicephalus sanguineus TaxID=34632 RepID=A0A9D4Q3Q7_RHISA|nr:hypothetical protein HPB52_021269 [Rhipicephalus sanguineus]
MKHPNACPAGDGTKASTDAEIEAAVSLPMSVDIGADCGMNETENAGDPQANLLQLGSSSSMRNA